jgi:enoyl-CoA hydratase/carnithine racemase
MARQAEVGPAGFVRVELDEAIATVRLGRPPMNGLSTQVRDEIAAAGNAAGSAIRAMVVYGGGQVGAGPA